jgi:hypothetical protein
MGGYHDAARGVGEGGDLWLRPALERGRYEAALARLTSGPGAPSDALLRALHTGAVAHYAGRFDASARALGAAAALAEDRYTKSLGRNGLAMLTSDLVLPYAPGRTERLLVHYYGLVGYLKQDSAAAAAVEARRLSRLLAQYGEDRAPAERATHALMHYLAGVAFEAAASAPTPTSPTGTRPPSPPTPRSPTAAARPAQRRRGAGAGPRRRRPRGRWWWWSSRASWGAARESGGTVRFDSAEVARLATGDADTSVLAIVRRRVAAARAGRTRRRRRRARRRRRRRCRR